MKNKKLHLILTAAMLTASTAFTMMPGAGREPSPRNSISALKALLFETQSLQMTDEMFLILKHFLGTTVTKSYIPDLSDINDAVELSSLSPALKKLVQETAKMVLTNFLQKLNTLEETPKENRHIQNIIDTIVNDFAWKVFNNEQLPQLTEEQLRDYLSPLATPEAQEKARGRVLEILRKINVVSPIIKEDCRNMLTSRLL